MSSTSSFKPDYVEKLTEMRDFCKKQLESKGLFVENTSDQIGLSISLTQFGLSPIYATLTQEEIEYIVDNGTEL